VGAAVKEAIVLPELGPALGRLVHPPVSGGIDSLLAPVRLSLVTSLLAAAGTARTALRGGDVAAARAALAPAVWATLWDRAAEEAATLLIRRVDEQITAAAVSARMPAWRADRQRVTDAEHRAIHARLGAGAGAMLRTAAELEQVTETAWSDQVLATARRMESAWTALATAAEREQAEWEPEIGAITAWRRPRWPLWAVTGGVLALALWLGLIFGGYIAVPGPLQPLAEFWWNLS